MRNIFSTLVLEQNPAYVEELEIRYGITLPPVFKAFVQTFEFGKFKPSPEHMIIHPNEAIGYDGFELTLNEVIDVYKGQGEYYRLDEILPIASCVYQGGICVGMSEENRDKIFIYIDGLEEKLRFQSANIFEFIKELKEVKWNELA